MSASDVLDHLYTLSHLGTFVPAAYGEAVAAEAGPATSLEELAARDAQLGAALALIEPMIVRAMRIRLDHALAHDTSIGAPTRTVFAQTIASYAGKLDLLAERARDVSARGGAGEPDAVAAAVIGAARAVLDLRDATRAGVLAVIRDLAAAAVSHADGRARDRTLEDTPRRQWSALRRELEALAAAPGRIAIPLATRLAEHPDQLDEGPPEKEVTFADMIELD